MAYAHFTDEQLLAEIAEYRAAVKKAAIGGGVGVVAGEGRRVEYVQSNLNEARAELRSLEAEAVCRGLEGYEYRGNAIGVEIG